MLKNQRLRSLLSRPGRAVAVALLSAMMLLFGGRLLPDRAASRAVAQLADPAIEPGRPQKPVSLRDRLIVGLKAISKSDKAFVDRVVARVNSGQLPKRLVDETFFWARQRAAGSSGSGAARRPIIYFRPAMTALARRIGVTL